jgi:AcrR family transcriptional regulator
MNRREASKQETRELIMTAARKLFREKDVEKCTMRAIAKEAGVSAASVVVHFKNKRALMEAALTEDIDHTMDEAVASMPPEGDFAERLTHIWRGMYNFYDANRNLYRIFVRSTVFEPEEETPSLTGQAIRFFDFIEELIDNEKRAGCMDSGVNTEIMSRVLFSHYFGVLIMFFRDASMTPGKAADLVLAMTRQTLAGLTRPAST